MKTVWSHKHLSLQGTGLWSCDGRTDGRYCQVVQGHSRSLKLLPNDTAWRTDNQTCRSSQYELCRVKVNAATYKNASTLNSLLACDIQSTSKGEITVPSLPQIHLWLSALYKFWLMDCLICTTLKSSHAQHPSYKPSRDIIKCTHTPWWVYIYTLFRAVPCTPGKQGAIGACVRQSLCNMNHLLNGTK